MRAGPGVNRQRKPHSGRISCLKTLRADTINGRCKEKRSVSNPGKDNERLEPVIWDVGALEGQTAHLEIVDAQTGGWGHTNVDQIEFSDLPGPREVVLALEELLPARFTGVRPGKVPGASPNSVD